MRAKWDRLTRQKLVRLLSEQINVKLPEMNASDQEHFAALLISNKSTGRCYLAFWPRRAELREHLELGCLEMGALSHSGFMEMVTRTLNIAGPMKMSTTIYEHSQSILTAYTAE
jgi:hypothetical protein